MKKIIFFISASLFLVSMTSTSFSSNYAKAKYAGEFMAIGVGARALAMGGAYVAVTNDVTAGYWNPAGLSMINYPQIGAMYAEQFAKFVNYNYAGFALPSSNNTTLALSMTRLGVDDIPVTALRNSELELGAIYYENGTKVINTPYIVKTINDAEWAFYLSYARLATEKFSYGANIKVVTKHVGDNSAWGLGFDVGMLYSPLTHLNIGLNFQDITTTLLAWDTGSNEAITPTLKTGAAYFFELPIISSTIVPAFDMDIRFENRRFSAQYNLGRVSFDTHLGLEFEYDNMLALRVGSDGGVFAAGAGLKLPKLNVDYAFLSHDALGDTHRISLMLTLKENRFERKR